MSKTFRKYPIYPSSFSENVDGASSPENYGWLRTPLICPEISDILRSYHRCKGSTDPTEIQKGERSPGFVRRAKGLVKIDLVFPIS